MELRLERGHGVLGERRGVDAAADGHEAVPCVELGAAREAGHAPQHVLGPARGRLGGHVLVGDEPVEIARLVGALLDVRGHGADPRIGEVSGHPAERPGLELDVRIGDEDGLRPVIGKDLGEPFVERVRLALAPDAGAHVEHAARVQRRAVADDIRGRVGARVVHDHDAQPLLGIVHAQETIDGRPDDGGLVPGRDEDRCPGQEWLARPDVVPHRMQSDEQVLPGTDERRERSQHHDGDEHHRQRAHASTPAGATVRRSRSTTS